MLFNRESHPRAPLVLSHSGATEHA
jgi:hypothetical protein